MEPSLHKTAKSTIGGSSVASAQLSSGSAANCRHFSLQEIKKGAKNFDESMPKLIHDYCFLCSREKHSSCIPCWRCWGFFCIFCCCRDDFKHKIYFCRQCEKPESSPSHDAHEHGYDILEESSTSVKQAGRGSKSFKHEKKISRNKMCPFGSKEKYKACCEAVAERASSKSMNIAAISEADIIEIAWGLEASKVPFLWVIRSGLNHGGRSWKDTLPTNMDMIV